MKTEKEIDEEIDENYTPKHSNDYKIGYNAAKAESMARDAKIREVMLKWIEDSKRKVGLNPSTYDLGVYSGREEIARIVLSLLEAGKE